MEESESLLECLESLIGDFQRNKISKEEVVNTLKNIVAYEVELQKRED